ncbi:hypothetical protein BDZ89DRAFT_682830, partial [Hymenopellis radicata]
MIKEVELPPKYSKSIYRRVMEAHKLGDRWTRRHTAAFIALKKALTSEPVLQQPRWDGTHFV